VAAPIFAAENRFIITARAAAPDIASAFMPPEIGLTTNAGPEHQRGRLRFLHAVRQIGERAWKTDKTDGYRLTRVSGLAALAGLGCRRAAVVVGGYLYYQNSEGADVSAELQQPSAATEASTSPRSQAEAASTSSSQQLAADAGVPFRLLEPG